MLDDFVTHWTTIQNALHARRLTQLKEELKQPSQTVVGEAAEEAKRLEAAITSPHTPINQQLSPPATPSATQSPKPPKSNRRLRFQDRS
jgi:hypothetical protein